MSYPIPDWTKQSVFKTLRTVDKFALHGWECSGRVTGKLLTRSLVPRDPKRPWERDCLTRLTTAILQEKLHAFVPLSHPCVYAFVPLSPPLCLRLCPRICPNLCPPLSPRLCPTPSPPMYPRLCPTLSPPLCPHLRPTLYPPLRPRLCPTLSPPPYPRLCPTLSPSLYPQLCQLSISVATSVPTPLSTQNLLTDNNRLLNVNHVFCLF